LVFFDVEVGDFEVLSEELEGEAEEGLVLGEELVVWKEGQGRTKSLRE
jgi:hypothetical protein